MLHTTMLDFNTTSAPEVELVSIIAETERIPETYWRLHTQLILKCSQLRVLSSSREPHLWTSSTHCSVLEHHGHDGKHGQSSVGNLGITRREFARRVLRTLVHGK